MESVSYPINRLSSLQLELLRIYALEPTPEEMEDIKRILGQYFGERLASKVEEQARKKKLSEQELDQWLDEEA